MKTMIKKTIASLMAMATVTTCASALVSAEEANAIDISYKTLEESIVANDGTTIPAGAVSVDVSISGNTGMSGTALEFSVDGELVKDSDGMAVVDSGNVFGRAATSGAQNGNKVVISEAAGEVSNLDGTLFTFYLAESSEVKLVGESGAVTGEESDIIPYSTRARKVYYIGDATGDGYISVDDVSEVISGLFRGGNPSRILPVDKANENISYYFPKIPDANIVDGDGNGYIMDLLDDNGESIPKYSESQQIMNYYSKTSAGLKYDVEGWDIGKKITVVV